MPPFIAVFVSPHEVEFMKQLFNDSQHYGYKFMVSGGPCNPLKYGKYKI